MRTPSNLHPPKAETIFPLCPDCHDLVVSHWCLINHSTCSCVYFNVFKCNCYAYTNNYCTPDAGRKFPKTVSVRGDDAKPLVLNKLTHQLDILFHQYFTRCVKNVLCVFIIIHKRKEKPWRYTWRIYIYKCYTQPSLGILSVSNKKCEKNWNYIICSWFHYLCEINCISTAV